MPNYYNSGNRKLQILHTRLRSSCSSLSNDLSLKNISESPLCLCGNVETTEHYYMHYWIYEAQRAELSQTVSQYSPFTLETLLFGNNTLPLNRSGGGVVDNTLDYQSRGRKIDPPLLRSFG